MPSPQAPFVNGDAVPVCLIDQIEAHNHPAGDLEDLEDEIEIALQPRCVDHNYGHIGIPEKNEVTGNLLIRAGREE